MCNQPNEILRMEQEAVDELLRRLHRAADEELMTRFNRVGARNKADGSVVTEADLAMQGRICLLYTSPSPRDTR